MLNYLHYLIAAPKLIGGTSALEGNVHVTNKNGFYGPVCDDGWDLLAANVVCRQLGHGPAIRAYKNSNFGRVGSNFAMDNVKCIGNERNIQDCPHITNDNCRATDGAGVKCKEGKYCCRRFREKE